MTWELVWFFGSRIVVFIAFMLLAWRVATWK